MALKTGLSDRLKTEQSMKDLEGFLKKKGYQIADFLDRAIDSQEGGSFQIQDPAEETRVGRLFKERRVCGIGNVYPDDKGILVRVYGKEYFERMKEDLEGYANQNDVNITLLLDKDRPEYHFPDRHIPGF